MENKVFVVEFNSFLPKDYYVSTLDIKEGDYVIVPVEKGNELGIVKKIISKEDITNLKEIEKIATEDDYNTFLKNKKVEKEAVDKCRNFVKELNLNMNVVNSFYSFDHSELLINFTADDRIDFRELAKKLAGLYHTRIELRQIGIRDKAKMVSGLGVCGQKLCCSAYLKEMPSVTMNKAKNQNIALNPTKINGICGRLLCCLNYEDEEYLRCSKGLLNVGSKIKYKGQDGVIMSVNILERMYTILVNEEKLIIKADEIKNDRKK